MLVMSKNVVPFFYCIAWVSGVSGEKGKDGSEKGREVKERNLLSLLPLPHPA